MNIAIVEDDPRFASELADMLARWERENGVGCQIRVFSDGDEILRYGGAGFDLILMDIEMKLVNGMDAAEQIRQRDSLVQIVFITANPQYAIRGYAVRALDYLLKPLSYEALRALMRRVQAELDRSAGFAMVEIVSREGTVRQRVHDLLWIASAGHRLCFHTAAGDYESTLYTLRTMEEKLAGHGFRRCNSGCLVNLRRVQHMNHDEITVDGVKLTVSRGRRRDFLDALAAYLV